MFRFVHASDLHLGAAFQGIRAVSGDAAEALHRATYDSLDSIVRLAVDEHAAMVLLAGDLCNRADGSLRAELALRKAAAVLNDHDIALLAVYGNHDYLSPDRPDLDWPPNTHVFPASDGEPRRMTMADGREVFIAGRSYSRRDEPSNLAAGLPEPPSGDVRIALLHAACGPVTDHAAYAPCTLDDLLRKRYDYWALGHVHTRSVLHQDRPLVVYPGNPQGLNPKETGPRGCYVVTVGDDGSIGLDFRETDAVRWYVEDVDISALGREQELLDAMRDRLSAIATALNAGRKALVRFRLVGRGRLHRFLSDVRQVAHLQEELQEIALRLPAPVWTESVLVQTRPDVDMEERRRAEDFVGDFLRIADELGNDAERLEAVWGALARSLSPDHERLLRELGVDISGAPAETKRERLNDAAYLGVDLLLGKES